MNLAVGETAMKQLIEAPICLSLFSFPIQAPLTATPTCILEINLVTQQRDRITEIGFCNVFWICPSSWLIFSTILKKLYLFSIPVDFLSCLTSSIRREDNLYLHNRDMGMRLVHSIFFFKFCNKNLLF